MVQEEKQRPTPGQRRQEEPAAVRSEQQRVEVTDVRSHRSTCTPENSGEIGEDLAFPTIEFKAFDLDVKVTGDHRKLADTKNRKHLDCTHLYWGSNQT